MISGVLYIFVHRLQRTPNNGRIFNRAEDSFGAASIKSHFPARWSERSWIQGRVRSSTNTALNLTAPSHQIRRQVLASWVTFPNGALAEWCLLATDGEEACLKDGASRGSTVLSFYEQQFVFASSSLNTASNAYYGSYVNVYCPFRFTPGRLRISGRPSN